MNFTDEQIEYIKNASDHVEMLCGGRSQGKTHQLINEMQDKINNLQFKIDKAIEYLYEHSQYNDGDGIHYIKEDEYCVDYLLDILKEDK